ncbi:hypothetical protein ACLESD_05215 [Pyxidicoccus sp. 3LFB2]
MRVPAGPELSLTDANFRRPDVLSNPWNNQSDCVGTPPSGAQQGSNP